ncbi:unnamed protein product [Arctogadus glacialis]
MNVMILSDRKIIQLYHPAEYAQSACWHPSVTQGPPRALGKDGTAGPFRENQGPLGLKCAATERHLLVRRDGRGPVTEVKGERVSWVLAYQETGATGAPGPAGVSSPGLPGTQGPHGPPPGGVRPRGLPPSGLQKPS